MRDGRESMPDPRRCWSRLRVISRDGRLLPALRLQLQLLLLQLVVPRLLGANLRSLPLPAPLPRRGRQQRFGREGRLLRQAVVARVQAAGQAAADGSRPGRRAKGGGREARVSGRARHGWERQAQRKKMDGRQSGWTITMTRKEREKEKEKEQESSSLAAPGRCRSVEEG